MVGGHEQRQQPQAAGALPDRGQQVRHFGADRGADRRRVCVEARRELPQSAHRGSRWLRPDGVLWRADARGGLVPPAQRPRARARPRDSPLLALIVRRRDPLQAAARARGGGQARRRDRVPETPDRRGRRDRSGNRGDQGAGRRRDPGGCRHGACVAPAQARDRAPVGILARRRSDVGAIRHRGRSPLHGRANDDGGPVERLHERRDDARSAHPRI